MNIDKRGCTVTDFTTHTKEIAEYLAATGRPLPLIENGEVTLVVQDLTAYKNMAALAEQALVYEDIRSGLEDTEHEEGIPAEELFKQMREIYDISASDELDTKV